MEHQIRKTFNKGQSRVVSVEVVRKRRSRPYQVSSNQNPQQPHALHTNTQDLNLQQSPDTNATNQNINEKPTARVYSKNTRHDELTKVLQRSLDKKHDDRKVLSMFSESEASQNSWTDQQYNQDKISTDFVVNSKKDSALLVPDTEHDYSALRNRKKLYRKNTNTFPLIDDEHDKTMEKQEKRDTDRLKHRNKYEQKYNKLDVQSLSQEDFMHDDDLAKEKDLLLNTNETTTAKKPENKLRASKTSVQNRQTSKIISLQPNMKVRELIQKLHNKKEELLKRISNMLNRDVSMDDLLDVETAALLVSELGYKYSIGRESRTCLEHLNTKDDPKKTKAKIPVVTVIGHVDHGKTTLLDALRSTSCAQKEHGGITQSIGADLVNIDHKTVTFIDTPGHELFVAMRKRGVQVTDLAVLVVAANDSIKPQTIEAIKHIQEANVPVVIAINKCDLPAANPDKVLRDLVQYGLVAESLGGDVLTVNISAKKKQGLDKLLDVILLQTEIQDLKYDPERPAEVYILDCWLKKGLGNVMNGIVIAGTLRPKDIFVINDITGKTSKLYDSFGAEVSKMHAGFPVLISGFKDRVTMGSKLVVVPNEYIAKRICSIRKYEKQISEIPQETENNNEMMQLLSLRKKIKCLFLVKARSTLMLNTLEDILTSFNDDNHEIKILAQDIGNVTLVDLQMASAVGAYVIKFDVDMETAAKKFMNKSQITVYDHRVIYHLLRDIEELFKRLIESASMKERPRAKILRIFNIKNSKIAGCVLHQGDIDRNKNVQIVRNGKIIGNDKIVSLHRYDESVDTVKQGGEFGIKLQNFEDFNTEDYLLFI